MSICFYDDYIVDDIGIWVNRAPSTIRKIVKDSEYELFIPKSVFMEAFDEYVGKELKRDVRAASTLATMHITDM